MIHILDRAEPSDNYNQKLIFRQGIHTYGSILFYRPMHEQLLFLAFIFKLSTL